MKLKNIAVSALVAVMVVALVTICGALGFLSEGITGTQGAVRGALLGGVVAGAILAVHGVRVLFARTPEAQGPQFNENSVEQHRLREAAAQAFADMLIVLGTLTAASFSILKDLDAFTLSSLLFLIAAADFGLRSLALMRKGL